jgi:hypothetical protein
VVRGKPTMTKVTTARVFIVMIAPSLSDDAYVIAPIRYT